MDDLNIYIDDAGQLHTHYKSNVFVYGGYWTLASKASEIERHFGFLKSQIFHTKQEVKASSMSNSKKKQIINRMLNKFKENFNPQYVCVNVSALHIDFDDKLAVQLHKNYLILRLVEQVIREKRRIFPKIQIKNINIFLDNQSKTSLGSFDSLERYLPKHLHGEYISRTFITTDCKINAAFKDSKVNNSIQIADVLVNSKYRYHNGTFPTLKNALRARNVSEPLKLPDYWSGIC